MIYINDFKDKKLVEYLKPGMRIRIDYPHGLGDVMMFAPYFERLKSLHPDVEMHLFVTPDKFPLIIEPRPTYGYDYIFRFTIPFNEDGRFGDRSKMEITCEDFLGIESDPSLDYGDGLKLNQRFPDISQHSPFIGVTLFSTHFPVQIDCRESTARNLIERIKAYGFLPIELQYYQWSRTVKNISNRRFPFVEATTRELKPDVLQLCKLISMCRGIASVATGTYHMAMVMKQGRTLFLQREYESRWFSRGEHLTKREIDVRKPWAENIEAVEDWLDDCKSAY